MWKFVHPIMPNKGGFEKNLSVEKAKLEKEVKLP